MTNFIYNILIFFFGLTHDMGLAVISLTVLVRLILWPLSSSALKGQKKLTELQPELAKVKERAGGDKQKESQLLLELYKEKEINPLTSCLPQLIQLPVLFALFGAFKDLTPSAARLYPFVASMPFIKAVLSGAVTFKASFLGLLDLSRVAWGSHIYWPGVALAILTGLLQYVQVQMLTPQGKKTETQSATASLNYFLPLLIVWFSLKWQLALPLYWTVFSLLAIVQQKVVLGTEVKLMERFRWKKRA